MDALTPSVVRKLLDAGVEQPQIVARLVATGNWSPAGAREIISFLTGGPDVLLKVGVSGRRKLTPAGRAAVAALRNRYS